MVNIKFRDVSQFAVRFAILKIRRKISKARPTAALFVFLGPILSILDESLQNEPLREIKLHSKRQGEIAELAFMRKAASLGFAIAKPWGESDRYDVVVRFEKTFWRIQVKSVRNKRPRRNHYCLKIVGHHGLPYSAQEIDFLVGYIFAEDIWYVLPAAAVEGRKALYFAPGSKRSQLEQYREAWKLMELPNTQAASAAAI